MYDNPNSLDPIEYNILSQMEENQEDNLVENEQNCIKQERPQESDTGVPGTNYLGAESSSFDFPDIDHLDPNNTTNPNLVPSMEDGNPTSNTNNQELEASFDLPDIDHLYSNNQTNPDLPSTTPPLTTTTTTTTKLNTGPKNIYQKYTNLQNKAKGNQPNKPTHNKFSHYINHTKTTPTTTTTTTNQSDNSQLARPMGNKRNLEQPQAPNKRSKNM
eukprot:TRINITY_DN3420_c0_g4_i1.p1 TRINITY_DN3420_c0_g4~~TRINITY_DN3420_c0_g4_i1.p1  ORF type:complete len:247 (+),score=83.85 TRINITY_DN3420_c0_g4_i1:95-742(+)